ncbi:MAG: hypothetical protein QOI68_3484, partial [Pseudonocardiales bacterium]|nr:hypothetical protein [Pseudonocardiales bacterium]
ATFTQRLLLCSVDEISGETHFIMHFRPKAEM